MLDDASRGFLGISLAETIVLAIGFVLLAVAAWAAIRSLDSLCGVIQEKAPDQWGYPGPFAALYRRALFRNWWVWALVMGIKRLDIADHDYRVQLWRARMRMLLCAVLFAAIIATLIWFSAQ